MRWTCIICVLLLSCSTVPSLKDTLELKKGLSLKAVRSQFGKPSYTELKNGLLNWHYTILDDQHQPIPFAFRFDPETLQLQEWAIDKPALELLQKEQRRKELMQKEDVQLIYQLND